MVRRELDPAAAESSRACDGSGRRSGLPGPHQGRKASFRSIDTSLDRVVLVSGDDRMVGTMAKLEAHRRGRRHRAISVILRDGRGRLLLQQRAPGKYHSAKLWTNTCCTHPRPDEPVSDAATRRLAEEMGIAASLTPLFTMQYRSRVSSFLVEHEFVHVFGGISDQRPRPSASEVASWRWMSWQDIRRDVDLRPQTYTVWFRKLVRDFSADIAAFCRQSAVPVDSFATRRHASAAAARRR